MSDRPMDRRQWNSKQAIGRSHIALTECHEGVINQLLRKRARRPSWQSLLKVAMGFSNSAYGLNRRTPALCFLGSGTSVGKPLAAS